MNMYKVLLVATSVSLVACSTTKPEMANAPETAQPKIEKVAEVKSEAKTETGTILPNSVTASEMAAKKLAERLRLAEALKNESVYFDFDSYAIRKEHLDTVGKQAKFLLENKNDTATLEGNCDERGSSEYNLALGEKRAYSVGQQLQLLGVPKEHIKIVSNGEEKPRMTCHDESCWKENRRVDFIHHL